MVNTHITYTKKEDNSNTRELQTTPKFNYDDFYDWDDDSTTDDYNSGDDDGSSGKGGKVSAGCFSETATVEVLNRGVVPMEDLRVGDYVVTSNTKSPYQLVYAFAHRETGKSLDYYQIHTEGELRPLQISEEHLLYVSNKAGPVRTDSIRVGDVLHARHNTFSAVTNIERVRVKGMYAPLTTDGTVVVDGIVASSYIDISAKSHEFVEVGGIVLPISQADIIHLWLSPLRVTCMMGVNSVFFKGHNDNGINHYVQFGLEFALWIEQQNILLQFAIFAVYLLLTSTSYMTELVCSAIINEPMALSLLAGLSVLVYSSIRDVRIRFPIKKKVD